MNELARFVRANASSIVATLLTWAVAAALTRLGIHVLVAAGAGASAGAISDFQLKRHWAFGRVTIGDVYLEGARYLTVSIGSLGLNLIVVHVLVAILRLPAMAAVIAASLLVGLGWNYPLHRWYVFAPARATSAIDR